MKKILPLFTIIVIAVLAWAIITQPGVDSTPTTGLQVDPTDGIIDEGGEDQPAIVPTHLVSQDSSLGWRAGKANAEDHFGSIDGFGGYAVIDSDGDKLESVFLEIDMETITVEDLEGDAAQKLFEHFLTSDFFDVREYPVATFESAGFGESLANDLVPITGTLTIRDITQVVETVLASSKGEDGQYVLTGTIILDRALWGIAATLGDAQINDTFEIDVEIILEEV